jgi:hypothetical protein
MHTTLQTWATTLSDQAWLLPSLFAGFMLPGNAGTLLRASSCRGDGCSHDAAVIMVLFTARRRGVPATLLLRF